MRPTPSFRSALALVAVLSSAAAGPLLAGETARVDVEIEQDDGEKLDLSISSSWLAPLLATLDVECEVTEDDATLRMARHLDRAGDGARYRFVDDDGDPVLAVREGGRLLLRTRDEDGEDSTVELPWSFAECFLLGREPAGGLLAGEGLRLHVDARDGDARVRIRID